jgi:RimJ/RimL family protein N-acetyltransferase
MLEGELVVLRDWRRSDIEAHYPTRTDVGLHALVDEQPWIPVPLEQLLAEYDKQLTKPADAKVAKFAVQRRDDPEQTCLGTALLWGINQHQRTAHLGLGLLPQVRGHGLGRDTVAVLCRYGFEVRDLHRLQLETLSSNVAMQKAAQACGFELEGRLRQGAWVMGERQDELIYGLLADQWRAGR